MTSLNSSSSGWTATRQTGSIKSTQAPATRHHQQQRQSPNQYANIQAARSLIPVGSRFPDRRHKRQVLISSSSPPATVSSTVLLVGGDSGGGGGSSGGISPRLRDSTTISPDEEAMLQRERFFRENYDFMTGVRIASTLGGFFLLVLLTLLYKSKCKGKHSREPSTLTLQSIPYPAPIHPAHLTLMRGQNIQVNGSHFSTRRNNNHHHDPFSSGGNGGNGSPLGGGVTQLLDNSCYGYMNQVHPTQSHQPLANFRNHSGGAMDGYPKQPAVLLITAANSESSEEEELSEPGRGGPPPPSIYPYQERPQRTKNSEIGTLPHQRHHSTTTTEYLHPPGGSPPQGAHKGNIDINVILPTPSISPSGSENFTMGQGGQYFGGATSLFPSASSRAAAAAGSTSNRGRLIVSRSLSSDVEENDQSIESNQEHSECSSLGEGSTCGGAGGGSNNLGGGGDIAAQMALAFGHAFSLDNLKYVDDTSSENIPTRGGSDPEEQSGEDTRSIGSDSVFACFEHNFDHVAPTYARRVSSVSGTSSGVLVVHSPYSGASSPRVPSHFSQHHSHRHHRYHPPPPPPPTQPPAVVASQAPPGCSSVAPAAINPSPQKPGGGESSSGFCEATTSANATTSTGGAGGTDFRVTLAHAQVHQRDSFCSDLESVNDYMETGHRRRRSSSTQTTLSDLRQSLGYCPLQQLGATSPPLPGAATGATSPGTVSLTSCTSPQQGPSPTTTASTAAGPSTLQNRRLSVPRRRRSLSPHLAPPGPPHLALSPRNSIAEITLLTPILPPQPPTSLSLKKSTSTSTSNPTSPTKTSADAASTTELTPATPTNPPPPPTVTLSPSSPFPAPKINRKRSFDATVRKTLSLQCEDKADVSSMFVSSSNETTPTN